MSRHSKHQRSVRIENPLPGGKTYTSWRRACRYVDEDRARWTDHTEAAIQFIASDRRHMAASFHFVIGDQTGDTGMATLDQIRGIPVINPIKLITDTNSPRTRLGRRQTGRSGPVKQVAVAAA